MKMKSMSLGRDSKHTVATGLIEAVAWWVIWTKDLGARSVLLCSRRGQVAAGDEVTCLCRCVKSSVIWRVGVSVISGIMDLFFIFSWCVFLFVTLWCRDCELRKFRVGAATTLCPPHTSVALNGFLHFLQTILTNMDGGFARHLFKTLIIDFPLGRFLSCSKMPGYGARLNMPRFMSGWFGDKHKEDWMIRILAWFCLFVYDFYYRIHFLHAHVTISLLARRTGSTATAGRVASSTKRQGHSMGMSLGLTWW